MEDRTNPYRAPLSNDAPEDAKPLIRDASNYFKDDITETEFPPFWGIVWGVIKIGFVIVLLAIIFGWKNFSKFLLQQN